MDIKTLFELNPLIVGVVPVLIGLVEIVKVSFSINTRYAGLLSVLLGVGLMFIASPIWQVAVVQGIIAGLMASGLYSAGKSTFAK